MSNCYLIFKILKMLIYFIYLFCVYDSTDNIVFCLFRIDKKPFSIDFIARILFLRAESSYSYDRKKKTPRFFDMGFYIIFMFDEQSQAQSKRASSHRPFFLAAKSRYLSAAILCLKPRPNC